MSAGERELAERFAYGAFIARPFALTSISIEHERDVEATMRIRVTAKSSDALRRAPDLNAFAAWVADGRQEDFLAAAPLRCLDRSA
jgi:hypothetical protein